MSSPTLGKSSSSTTRGSASSDKIFSLASHGGGTSGGGMSATVFDLASKTFGLSSITKESRDTPAASIAESKNASLFSAAQSARVAQDSCSDTFGAEEVAVGEGGGKEGGDDGCSPVTDDGLAGPSGPLSDGTTLKTDVTTGLEGVLLRPGTLAPGLDLGEVDFGLRRPLDPALSGGVWRVLGVPGLRGVPELDGARPSGGTKELQSTVCKNTCIHDSNRAKVTRAL
mmetsp:Transcript_16575/g.38975  ORF Transcript_16575/g.38975 Transcript_16575/m.38975 type:complete len:227 (+) Transcript_16575:758-1438(+)